MDVLMTSWFFGKNKFLRKFCTTLRNTLNIWHQISMEIVNILLAFFPFLLNLAMASSFKDHVVLYKDLLAVLYSDSKTEMSQCQKFHHGRKGFNKDIRQSFISYPTHTSTLILSTIPFEMHWARRPAITGVIWAADLWICVVTQSRDYVLAFVCLFGEQCLREPKLCSVEWNFIPL